MAAVIPNKLLEQLTFCEAHAPVWAAAPATAIGLTSAQVTSFTSLVTAARAAFTAAEAAREASKGATTTYHAKMEQMRDNAADLVRTIKAFAELQAVPATVYGLAQIPEPLPPQPIPAPGKPNEFSVVLETDGSVTLSWAAENAAASSGAFYAISRKLPGQSAFTMIGGTSGSTNENRRMSFNDATIPTSAAGQGAVYRVQGQRGSTMGEASDAITVQFGVDGAGGAFATIGATSTNAGSEPRGLRVAA